MTYRFEQEATVMKEIMCHRPKAATASIDIGIALILSYYTC
jgi:hypothetical protein